MILQNFLRFCVVGALGVLIDMGITFSCKEWIKMNKYVANAIGFLVAASSNFFLNRWWAFQSTSADISIQYIKFVTIASLGLLMNTFIIYLLTDKLRWNFYISKITAMGLVTFWNFFMNYLFTF